MNPEPLLNQEKVDTHFSVPICANILSCFKLGRSVHPLQPVAPEHSEFFQVSSRRRIRIIHIKPDTEKPNEKFSKKNVVEKISRRSFRLSTEEYWFTRWNRPVRNTQCNCSFRRSQRNSKFCDRLSIGSSIRKSMEVKWNRTDSNHSIEKYAEKLISKIFKAALQEFSIQNGCGVVNVSYTKSENNELDTNRINNHVKSDKNQSIKVENSVLNDDLTQVVFRKTEKRKTCTHLSKTKAAKPIVLLLHGIGSSAEIWWDVLECLVCAGYEVIAPDMLGHGYSSVPNSSKAYTFSNLLKDIIAIFDKYVPSAEIGQCIVIGHSYGCSLAGALARYREQQIVQLVLISGGGPTPLAPPVSSAEISVFGCMQILMKPLLFCGIKRTIFYSSRGKHFDSIYENDLLCAVPQYVLRYISEGQYWPEGDAAFHRRIFIPTLLVHGLQDTNVTLVQECEMERTIPRSFLEVIPTAGHMAMLETPEQLCHMLLCFFDWWNK